MGGYKWLSSLRFLLSNLIRIDGAFFDSEWTQLHNCFVGGLHNDIFSELITYRGDNHLSGSKKKSTP